MPRILLSHGAGGREMLNLIEQVFRRHYSPAEVSQDDSAILTLEAVNLAFTTDAFVVSPLFFPGGDIGRLAVAGTVNDLLTAAARPIALAAAFILEEGFPIASLQRHHRFHAADGRRGRGEHCHRRHQGCPPGFGRSGVYHHDRGWVWSCGPASPGPRPGREMPLSSPVRWAIMAPR